MIVKKFDRKRITAAMLIVMAALFVSELASMSYAQQVKRKQNVKQEETFTRPKPTRPIRPEIPSANRYQQDKIFLEFADSLYKLHTYDTIERQIVKGNVKFRQAGMWMFCDSAYYYPTLNSLDAFGHVKMEQGDTLFVYADKLYYEGNDRMARLKNGPSNAKVRLINRDVTLTTDSLDYSLAMELGWYEKWGTIDDKVNTLTSLYGEYSPGTKNADFYNNVVLVNNRDGYTLLTDTLHYNTTTHIARIESDTEIQGANDTIVTRSGLYNTEEGNAELLSRSMIMHKDSNNNVTTLEGDSIIYDKQTRISRAYMFKDPLKHGMPMIITDTARNTTLVGGFGLYNDSTREALATDYPLLMEYSQGDTLFMRADTIKSFIITEMVHAPKDLQSYEFPRSGSRTIIKADSLGIWIDDEFFSLTAPLWEEPARMLLSALPSDYERDKIERKKSHPDIPARPMMKGSIISDLDLPMQDMAEDMEGNEQKDITPSDSSNMIPKEFHMALAYHRARFFKQDLQGVADSMVVVERDSMLYMFRKPIVWSGERQVTGNRIDVHFNDSTADWALLPESGMMSEHVDEDFYNQLTGKKMLAFFANQTLRRLEVSGNVETIFLPMESDSTYNRLVTAESSYLTIDLDSGRMERLKMWPETSGTVSPIFLVKRQQMYLRQFRWWDSLRPVREHVGSRLRWQDELGEVSDELEKYFTSPSEFGEPRSFPSSRPVINELPAILWKESTDSISELEKESEIQEEEIGKEVEKIKKVVEENSSSKTNQQ